jgi:hypothetical protein
MDYLFGSKIMSNETPGESFSALLIHTVTVWFGFQPQKCTVQWNKVNNLVRDDDDEDVPSKIVECRG